MSGHGRYSTNFMPIVTVYDDGHIEVDWSDSQGDAYDWEHESFTVPQGISAKHSDMLSEALGDRNADGTWNGEQCDWERIRNLVVYMQARAKGWK